MKFLPLLSVAFALTACQAAAPAETAATVPPSGGEALALSACAGCHAVQRFRLSPNSDAPPFADIVNQRGLTAETLSTWLRDAHNYPQEMEFTLDRGNVDALVDYMLTLRDPNYRPPV